MSLYILLSRGLNLVCFFPRPEWYGMLYSQADSKKKSNLMMSLFEPGAEPLPWLGKISHLGPISGDFLKSCVW